ncbi:MAG: nicotinate (nicotinamide) nucleotide adenylyltransferase [Bacteroidales bacterium]|nr:nicotinate (nicotinamide) nucleotide adenylyltransferase [Bacteroidales bacterium]
MRIAVFSGSFNPLHIGHLAILERLCGERRFDGVYLVISPVSPFKEDVEQPSGKARYNAAVAAVKRHPELQVKVDDIELGMEAPHYTITTLDALKRREPDNDFTLVIGADNLAEIRRWKDYQKLLTKYGVAVYPRGGIDLEAVRSALLHENSLYDIAVIEAPLIDISSTRIREGMARGEDMSAYLM